MNTAKKSNQRTKKDPLDRYYTPAWVTEILVENWPFPSQVDLVWEPCAGRGHIANVIEGDLNILTYSSDVVDTEDGDRIRFFEYDFLGNVASKPARLAVGLGRCNVAIITNPPYSIPGATASDFVRKALEYTPYVAMLLRLSWLEACEDRKSIFAEQPPAEVWILPRVKFEGPNTNGGSPSSTSAWFIWKPGTTKTKLMWVGGEA